MSPIPIAYSIVKASIGSSLEALMAGKTPKTTPIRAQTQLAAHIESDQAAKSILPNGLILMLTQHRV